MDVHSYTRREGSRTLGRPCAKPTANGRRSLAHVPHPQAEQRHSQELAAALMDAEAHETEAVERALAQERLRCGVCEHERVFLMFAVPRYLQ